MNGFSVTVTNNAAITTWTKKVREKMGLYCYLRVTVAANIGILRVLQCFMGKICFLVRIIPILLQAKI